MSADWESALLQPITADRPAGQSLEDTELLASFDAFRVFGESVPLGAPAENDEKRIPKPFESQEWAAIRDKSLEALSKSHDLRLLAYLGAAVLRTDGVAGFSDTLNVAAGWLESYWNETYPQVADDVIFRRSALSCFADPMAMIDGIRRVPLVRSRQHGTFTLRDVDIAAHVTAPGKDEAVLDERQIQAAFAATPLRDLSEVLDSVQRATAALDKIDGQMREGAGAEAAPGFDPLKAQLSRISQVLKAQIASHPEAVQTAAAEEGGNPGDRAVSVGGVVTSRQDAIRALDAVAAFFRRTEPSSPVPMFLERAKRLVSKDFLEVLADIAPEAVAQARAAGGLRDL